MQSNVAFEFAVWFELLLVLVVGAAAIVGAAVLAGRLTASAVWQRTIWQVSTLALLALLAVECTGTGRALVRLCWPKPCATAVPAVPDGGAPAVPAAAIETRMDTAAFRLAADGTSALPPRVAVPAAKREMTDLSLNDLLDTNTTADTAVAHASEPMPLSTADTAVARERALPPVLMVDMTADHEAAEVAAAAHAERGYAWWPGAIWAFGTAVLLLRMIWAGVLLRGFRRRCIAVGDEAVCRRVAALARRLGIRRPVRVLAAGGLRVPVAFGSLRPTIVLPLGFEDEFEAREQEAVLLHELAHLSAGDPAWHRLASWLCALWWWQPLAWWARRKLRAASEAAADEASLLVPDGPSVLAACLVQLGRRLARRRQLGWLSVEGNGFRSGLGRRVARLLNLGGRSWRAPGRGRLVGAQVVLPVALVLIAVSCTAWAQPQAPFAEGGTTMGVLKNSWRCSLAATALWALLGPAPVATAAEDGPKEIPKAVLKDAERPGHEARPAAKEERRERREGEAREGDRPDRPRGEAREGDRPPRGEGAPPPEAVMQHRRQLEEMARDIKQKLEGLKDGQEAEARELRQKLERITQALREMPHAPPGPHPEQARLAQRLEQIKRQIAELKEAGKHDEVERLEREAREIMQALQRRPEGSPTGPAHPEGAQDLERRIMHLRVAVDNLRAAGLPDQAENLVRLIEHLKAGGPEGGRVRPEGPPRPEGPARPGPEGRPRGESRPDAPAPPRGDRTGVEELRNEVQQMRREMQDLREALKKLQERAPQR